MSATTSVPTDPAEKYATGATLKRLKRCNGSAAKFFAESVPALLFEAPTPSGFVCHCWRFGRPDSTMDMLRITSLSGQLILTGDHGVCVWERDDNMIAWARGAIGSLSYFAEKVCREVRIREYDAECVADWVAEQDKCDPDDQLANWSELREQLLGADGEAHVNELLCAAEVYELPDFDNYTARFLMQRAGLRHFFHKQFGDPL